MSAWIDVIGIGEEGVDGLLPAARHALEAAEVILGGERHQKLAVNIKAERISWPSPFDVMIDTIAGCKGRRLVILATGDPLWYSVGARIAKTIPADQITFHPQLSAFQYAACRMSWSMADSEQLTVHGRPVEQMIPFIQPDQNLLVLTTGSETPKEIASFLTRRGFGQSELTVFASLGGPAEARFDGRAQDWSHEVPAFNTMAIRCIAGNDAQILPRHGGLPDAVFQSDGTMTKQEVRAITLARLMPMRGALLWDLGCGAGSVSIEWMRAARDAEAIGIERRDDRRAMARDNALALGTPRLDLRGGTVLDALADLPAPDAVFIGGGLSREVVEIALKRLKPHGRIVANAVTLESEALLSEIHARHGGQLTRIAIQRAEPIGPRTGWRPQMPVTQWSLTT